MSGAHRGPGGDSIPRSLAALAALVLVPAAVIAGLVWFFANATDLELSASVLILSSAGLVKGLVQGKLDMVWISASVVVSSGWRVVSDVSHHPAGGMVGFVVLVVALVCLGIAFVLMIKDGSLGQVWKARRARLASGPGDDGPRGPG